MIFSYEVRGEVHCPEGTTVDELGTTLILPDGRALKVWEVFEDQATGEDLSFEQLQELGVSHDGADPHYFMEVG